MIPEMIAASNDIHAGSKNIRGFSRRDAIASRRVFTIRDDHIKIMPLTQIGQQFLHCLATGRPYNIANEQQLHTTTVAVVGLQRNLLVIRDCSVTIGSP